MRNLRKYNYVNVFNQVGFSQIPEMGNVVNAGGIRAMVKYMPEFRKIMSRAKDGKLNNEFLDEIETLVSGTGSNRLVDSTINRTDDFAGVTTKVGKIEKGKKTKQMFHKRSYKGKKNILHNNEQALIYFIEG